jgi:predicted ribonuclease YlaK
LGQKGTVLLKFYLSSGNNCPIFIDQPEDHLDNDFIYHDLVKTIRAAKIKRQVVMVTHDANLVVNGDADQVIVSKYLDQVISHNFSGSLENPTIRDAVSRILEGGKEAFQKREQKYQYEYV